MTDMIKRNLLRTAKEGRIGLLCAQVRYLNAFAGHILQQMTNVAIYVDCDVVFVVGVIVTVNDGVVNEQRSLFTIDTSLAINICDLN